MSSNKYNNKLNEMFGQSTRKAIHMFFIFNAPFEMLRMRVSIQNASSFLNVIVGWYCIICVINYNRNSLSVRERY